MTDEMDRRLREYGEQWRARQPEPAAVDTAALDSRRVSRWLMPLAAAAVVATVIGGGAVLLDENGGPGRPRVIETADPSRDVVPFVHSDTKHEATYLPDCEVSDLDVDRKTGAAAGTTTIMVFFSTRGQPCAMRQEPAVRLLDGDAELPVKVRPTQYPGGEPGDAVVGRGRQARLVLSWSSMRCSDSGDNDRIELRWGAAALHVDGFGPLNPCGQPDSDPDAAVIQYPTEPEGWGGLEGQPILAPLTARQVDFVPGVGDGVEPATFVIELLATERDLSLGYCPDARLEGHYSYDDVVETRYNLNCAAVPYKDADGTPYLPKGKPVRFAVDWRGWVHNVELFRWVLVTPREISIPLTVPAEHAVPPTGSAQPAEASPSETSAAPLVRQVPGEEANVHLWVSNQSLDHPEVPIQVYVDGVLVVDEVFVTEGGHNYVDFHVRVTVGPHRVRVVAGDVARDEDIKVSALGDVWALASHWQERDGNATIEWTLQYEPLKFD